MDNKFIRIIKKVLIIPVSLLLLFYLTAVCAMIGYFIIAITGVEWLFYLSFGIAGYLSSLPIACKVWNADNMRKGIKIVLIVLLVLIFSIMSYALLCYD